MKSTVLLSTARIGSSENFSVELLKENGSTIFRVTKVQSKSEVASIPAIGRNANPVIAKWRQKQQWEWEEQKKAKKNKAESSDSDGDDWK